MELGLDEALSLHIMTNTRTWYPQRKSRELFCCREHNKFNFKALTSVQGSIPSCSHRLPIPSERYNINNIWNKIQNQCFKVTHIQTSIVISVCAKVIIISSQLTDRQVHHSYSPLNPSNQSFRAVSALLVPVGAGLSFVLLFFEENCENISSVGALFLPVSPPFAFFGPIVAE